VLCYLLNLKVIDYLLLIIISLLLLLLMLLLLLISIIVFIIFYIELTLNLIHIKLKGYH